MIHFSSTNIKNVFSLIVNNCLGLIAYDYTTSSLIYKVIKKFYRNQWSSTLGCVTLGNFK